MNTDIKKTHRTLIIPETHANERLDQALAKLLPEYSRTQIQHWIETGSILVNGNLAKTKTKIKGGETILITPILKLQPQWEAQAIPLQIIYEDDELIVINKPVGLVVHPGAGNADNTLLNALLYHAPELQSLPRAGIIHRLDKDTSGLLVIAKTPMALQHLSRQLKKRAILREYQAIVYGAMISGGNVDAPIGRHPLLRKRMAVIDTGKTAITHYRVAEKYRAHTRLHVRLETGRTHQIRVHMAYIHHPIVGDSTYGGRTQLVKNMAPELIQQLRQFKRQALHAFALGLIHPRSNKFVRWEIDLPNDIQQLITLLRDDMVRNK
ncbi:MAG: 23S rRNA pseudouridine(1911/1915/1917) synthase RluD [Gammaproteobacteria bacterium]|nr:23S rRNA pseudouridine(1911/1915/1917) synthase RluD [Gammaproteobacteria bacterium]MCW5583745.1 23S rRNA pseudouridine(1911/1915/1917) synthase RluD [Gammaproteobacteria bacterium]